MNGTGLFIVDCTAAQHYIITCEAATHRLRTETAKGAAHCYPAIQPDVFGEGWAVQMSCHWPKFD